MADPDCLSISIYGHSGEGPGYSLVAFYNTKQSKVVAIFCNTENGGVGEELLLDIFNNEH